jgi:hypothetical protein
MNLHVNVRRSAMRRSWYIAPVLACVAFAVCAQQLDAQTPANRFWMTIGGGVGKSGPSQSLGQDQYSGPSGDLALGATLTSRGLIGIEVAGWRRDTPIGPSRTTWVTLTLQGYPFGSALNNLYFQGGLGVGNAAIPIHFTQGVVSRLNVTRPSLQVALGYDIPIACPVWITPFFQSYDTFGGRRFIGPSPTPDVHESANAILFHAGLSLKFAHPGPKGDCRHRAPALTQQ